MRPLFIFLALVPAGSAPAQTLGIAITQSTANDYDADVQQAMRGGATATSLTLFWDEAVKDGRYAPESDWPSIANSYYPGKNMGLFLALAVIDTVTDGRPESLRALPFDTPRVISAFTAYAGEVLSRLEDTDLVAISIGNEVDGYLTTRQVWDAFAAFFIAAKATKAAVQVVSRTWWKFKGGVISG